MAAAVAAGARPSLRDPLDASALAAIAVIALQLLPLPPAVREVLAPASDAFRAQMVLDYSRSAWLPLSLDPPRTQTALMLAAAAYGLFAATRAAAPAHGRRIARRIAWMAMAAAIAGIGGQTLFPDGRIYGFWKPREPGASPFGVVINRNHFAAWAAMAAALTAGCYAAHLSRRRERAPHRRTSVAVLGDARGVWLMWSAGVTIAAIAVAASRSGFAAVLAAAVTVLLLIRRRATRRVASALLIALLVAGVALVSWAPADRLLSRIGDTGGNELAVRKTIWMQSAAIARRYPLTGVGAGSFPAAMTHYQTGAREVFFNHAHNQYLELAAEGGLLLGIPLLLFAGALVVRIRRELRTEQDSYVWLRIGAAAALTAIAVASIWESPFRTPATLMLAAVAAGLAAAPGSALGLPRAREPRGGAAQQPPHVQQRQRQSRS